MQMNINRQGFSAGTLVLALRLVAGWTYFSAFWRRLVLEDKLDPEAAGYIGEKFNHFLPNALGIKPLIEYLVTHPDMLFRAMVAFTIIEGVVGLFFMLGLLTRWMSLAVAGLATGILLGAGWLGTTCLDEWQIGVLGVAAGFTVFLSGGGRYSLDHWLFHGKRNPRKWMLTDLPLTAGQLGRLSLYGSIGILVLTLLTNQYFHGGVYGTLHNKSVRPKLEISDVTLEKEVLHFTVYRTEGADVYGSFLIRLELLDNKGSSVFRADQYVLAGLAPEKIRNHYVARIKPGQHSLVIPLGARADIDLDIPGIRTETVSRLRLTDISGLEWTVPVKL